MLLGTMRDPGSDLNFAIFLWWVPVPAVASVLVIIDHLVGSAKNGPESVQPPRSLDRPEL